MKNTNFILESKNLNLIFSSFISIYKLLPLYGVKIEIKIHDKIYCIADDTIQCLLDIFSTLLVDVLNNQLQLHRSIDQDVGFLWNEELHNLVEGKLGGEEFWVGENNLLWSTPGNIKPSLATWLYNDKDGNIIFEVTPTYYWNFIDPLSDEQDYITYEEFIKNYKPLLIKKISKETAEEWILKIDELMRIIQNNEKKFLSEHRSV